MRGVAEHALDARRGISKGPTGVAGAERIELSLDHIMNRSAVPGLQRRGRIVRSGSRPANGKPKAQHDTGYRTHRTLPIMARDDSGAFRRRLKSLAGA